MDNVLKIRFFIKIIGGVYLYEVVSGGNWGKLGYILVFSEKL